MRQTATYTKLLPNGFHEYGFIAINKNNRRKDKMVKLGEASYDEAVKALAQA